MSFALETIVRPFETPLVITQGRVVVSRLKVPITPAETRWGAVGTLPTATEVPKGGGFTVKDCNTNFAESARVGTDVRVENPHDKTQFVVVRRIDSITFKKPDKGDQSNSYVAYSLKVAESQLDVKFDTGRSMGPTQKCEDQYQLDWARNSTPPGLQ
jgi:hypothetical protein